MAEGATWIQLPIDPAWEPAFWAALQGVSEQPELKTQCPPAVQTLLQCIVLDVEKETVINTNARIALTTAADKLKQVYNFLDDSRPLASAYASMAGANWQAFQESAFAQELYLFFTDWDLFQSLAGWKLCPELMFLILGMHRHAPNIQHITTPAQLSELAQKALGSLQVAQLASFGNAALAQADLNEVGDLRLKTGNTDASALELQVYTASAEGRWERLNLHHAHAYSETPINVLFYLASEALILLFETTPAASAQRLVLLQPAAVLDGAVVTEPETRSEEIHAAAIQPLESLFRPATEAELASWQQRKGLVHLFTWQQGSKREQVELRNTLVGILAMLVNLHFAQESDHSGKVLIGYMCSLYGLLQDEDSYLDTDTHTTYREYLRSSINNALQRLSE